MKIMLIGGLGFIGKHLIRRIRNLGKTHELSVFDNSEAKLRNLNFINNNKLKIEVGDIRDKDCIEEALLKYRPEMIVHLAALTGIGRCNENPSFAFSVNVFGTYNVIEACKELSTKLIFISSGAVYGESKSGRTSEDEPLNPNNIYGLTKLLAENLVRWGASKFNLEYTILRLTNVYGPEGDKYGIQIMIKKALKDRKIQIFGKKQQMNLVYIEDVVDAINHCLINPLSSKQTFNIGSNNSLPINEIVLKIIEILNLGIEIEYLPMRHGETSTFRPDLSKSEEILGYNPKTDLFTGLKKTIDWYQNELKNR